MDINESMIYDPWPLVDGILERKFTLQNATQYAISLLEERAAVVGKLKLWEGNFSGRKEKKARKVHGPEDDKDLVPKARHSGDNDSMSSVNQ